MSAAAAAAAVRVALVPLDERPVNTRYPRMLAAIAGARVLLPPSELLGRRREPADVDGVARWLVDLAGRGAIDAAVVSCDLLGYGNLINARISQDGAPAVIERLGRLKAVSARVPVHAFSLVTRVSDSDHNVEEPEYWDPWGPRLAAYARWTHQAERGALPDADRAALDALAPTLPPELVADWLLRRLRNHAVNLALIDMAARGDVAALLLTSDDTAPYGFPTRERDWLAGWLALIGPAARAVRMHPGADEVGSALVARLIVQAGGGEPPGVWVEYDAPDGAGNVAPYEDRPVREGVAGQIEACGCRAAASAAACDFVLGVATPSPRRADYRPEFLGQDRAAGREALYSDFLRRLGAHQAAGRPVALADVAYPNGSDPLLSALLLAPDGPLAPSALTAYGAWNTAGNTLGTVIAQAACALRLSPGGSSGAELSARRQAQAVCLTHHFLEDYGYQQIVRRETRAWMSESAGRGDPSGDAEVAECAARIAARLGGILGELQERGIGQGLRIAPGSVRLPWRRLFEVDFEIEPTPDPRAGG